MSFKRGNLEKQVLVLPEEVKWCKRCVISNQRPRTTFDSNGVCSACQYSDYKNNAVDLSEKEVKALILP